MSGWDMLAVALILVSAAPLLWRWAIRWSSREFDRHVDMATALANDPRQLRKAVPCQCRGRLRDASGVWHGPELCMPSRERIGGVR